MATLALPTGSLHESTLSLFGAAGLTVRRSSSRALRAVIDFDGIDEVVFGKAREIPGFVADGTFDLGLAGTDWIEESGAKIEVVHEIAYSKTTTGTGWRVVLAVPFDHPATTPADLPAGVRVASEYPAISRRYFEEELGLDVRVVHSLGSTEAKVPGLADAVLEVVETGASLRHNNLRELATVRHCGVQLIAGERAWADPAVRAVAEQIATLLRAARAAQENVLLTVVIPVERWQAVRGGLAGRWWLLDGGQDVVAQVTCTRESVAETVIRLTEAGALQVVETPMSKLVVA
uniref:ATP phosphoribosyltransferase n=1 Tax=Nocardia interforma ATCC 21072 TaxID=1311815 RepID=A0A5S9A8J2_9NOCA|nr:ATP phosphoribosyltransferase [Nocardia interforma ATCC 21072]